MEYAARYWSTDDARPGEAISYWIDAICEAFLEMKADSPQRREFAANIAQHEFGRIDLNFADTTCQKVWRTPAAIAGSRKHTYYLLYMREGRLVARQRGREASLGPGECVLIDGMMPYSFDFPETNRCLSVQMPGEWLERWLPRPETVIGRSLSADRGWGATLASAVGNLAESDFEHLALSRTTIADQLGALLALAGGREAATATTHRRALLARIRRSIAERMSDVNLNAADVATMSGISRRYLHLILAEAGGSFGGLLMDLRLEHAHALLEDRRNAGRSIAEIAWQSGFRDASHFARRYRARYGLSPAAFRRTVHG